MNRKFILPGIIIGLTFGALVGGLYPQTGIHLEIIGDILLNLLMMVVVPLVIFSIITSITRLGDVRNLGVLGRRTIVYYLATTALSVFIGIVMVNIVQPGKSIARHNEKVSVDQSRIIAKDTSILNTVKEVLTGDRETGREGMIPRNIVNAMLNMDFLGIIVFSILLGVALSVLGQRVQPAVDVFDSLNEAVHLLIHWIMYVVPFGIFGIVAARIGHAGGFQGFLPELAALAKYSAVVVLGLAIHGFITLPIILFLFLHKNPFTYMVGMLPALLNAFSTASSAATLPLTLEGVEEENHVSPRVAGFVLPIGATINMDGTALYEAVAVMFIAQAYGIHLDLVAQTIIFITAILAAIGAAAIPEAGLVTMVIVLNAVGLPVEGIGLLLTIDWLLDRFRTTVNVWGDAVGAGVIDSFSEPMNSAQE
jgi:Na+/H+-dicarboxylate symporter